MSDHEAGGMPSDEDLSLPKATVTKMIQGACLLRPPSPRAPVPTRPDRRAELLRNEITCAKDTRDLVIECCVGEGPTPFPRARPPLMRALCSVLSLQ